MNKKSIKRMSVTSEKNFSEMEKFSLTLLVISSAVAHPFNDWSLGWYYPETCCQLEWTNISKGDPLPPDYVPAGKFMNRNWAYTLYTNQWKSDQRGN